MIKRHLAKILNDYATYFPVVLLTGMRQVGKSTLLEMELKDKVLSNVSFDELQDRALAENDPNLFFKINKAPVIIDEVQYVPSIFRNIKILVDKARQNGSFFLTGSQSFKLMGGVSESLAGRIGILEIMPISIREEEGDNFTEPFVPTGEYIAKRGGMRVENLWDRIYRGFFPELIKNPHLPPAVFFSSYVKTYLERDLREIINVQKLTLFEKFLRILAYRSGSIINYSDISSVLGINDKTVKSWVEILEQSGLIFHLQPYFGNSEKKLTKSPKLYFSDTGLLCYLLGGIDSGEDIEKNVFEKKGSVFETFVISEIRKSFLNAGKEPCFSFYRESGTNLEVDLLIEIGNRIYPVEIKSTKTPSDNDARNFKVLTNIRDREIESPVVVCDTDRVGALKNKAVTLPATWI